MPRFFYWKGGDSIAKEIDIICKKIESEREKLNELLIGNDLTLQQSKIVDEYINEYYKELLRRQLFFRE